MSATVSSCYSGETSLKLMFLAHVLEVDTSHLPLVTCLVKTPAYLCIGFRSNILPGIRLVHRFLYLPMPVPVFSKY